MTAEDEKAKATRSPETMLSRFEGAEGRKRLVTALQEQVIVHGDPDVATAIAERATLRHVESGAELIKQDAADSDVYLILSGVAAVLVNGREVARRSSGFHVGEMALIDPTAKRSATVRAVESSVVAVLTEPAFSEIADRYPKLWRRIAVELADRIRQRARFHREPNTKPMIFIGSSTEALPIAERIQAELASDSFIMKLWTDGIFEASATTIESLTAVVNSYDFGIIILSADDLVEIRGKTRSAPRDNTVFELGLLMGGFGRSRTFIVRPRGVDLQIPSDLLGITCLTLDLSTEDGKAKSVKMACDQLREKFGALGPR